MKRRKLRGYVIPTISLLFACTIIFSGFQIYSLLRDYDLEQEIPVVNTKQPEVVKPVINESKSIIRPYESENVNATIPFYNISGTEEQQQAALIYYEGIYMQNTGVLYTSNEEFDVVSILDGVVLDIKEDSIMGNIIEIESGSNVTTVYQSVKDVKVTIGSTIHQGDVIATSGQNKLTTDASNALHFEVFYKGELVNPEDFYLLEYEEVMS